MNIRVNVQEAGQTYEQKIDGPEDRKYIRGYTFGWWNPWCHGTWELS